MCKLSFIKRHSTSLSFIEAYLQEYSEMWIVHVCRQRYDFRLWQFAGWPDPRHSHHVDSHWDTSGKTNSSGWMKPFSKPVFTFLSEGNQFTAGCVTIYITQTAQSTSATITKYISHKARCRKFLKQGSRLPFISSLLSKYCFLCRIKIFSLIDCGAP